ncbi:MAG: hypothetical protein AAB881_00450 [Patescibacteria group bacterium]
MKKTKLLLWLAAAVLIAMPLFVGAQQKGVQISPLSYEFTIAKGAAQTATLTVKNLNTSDLNYVAEAQNFAEISDDGAPVFDESTTDTSGAKLAGWINFGAAAKGTIKAGESKEIIFTITVPENASAGGHYAGVFAKEVKSLNSDLTEVGVASRIGALLLVTVPGDVVKSASINELKTPGFITKGPANFSVVVKNTGTVHYDSDVSLEIKPMIGKSTTISMGSHTILPSGTRSYTASWNKNYPIGYYSVKAIATDPDGNEMTKTSTFWALPIMIVVPAVVLIIILIIILSLIGKKKEQELENTPSSSQPPSQQ